MLYGEMRSIQYLLRYVWWQPFCIWLIKYTLFIYKFVLLHINLELVTVQLYFVVYYELNAFNPINWVLCMLFQTYLEVGFFSQYIFYNEKTTCITTMNYRTYLYLYLRYRIRDSPDIKWWSYNFSIFLLYCWN